MISLWTPSDCSASDVILMFLRIYFHRKKKQHNQRRDVTRKHFLHIKSHEAALRELKICCSGSK
jgi:hypothetical protein